MSSACANSAPQPTSTDSNNPPSSNPTPVSTIILNTPANTTSNSPTNIELTPTSTPSNYVLWLPLKTMSLSKHVYAVGDSLTATGYPAYLGTLLGSDYQITNIGIAGTRTDQMLAKFNSEVLSPGNANYVIIWGGINDVLQGRSASDIEANLQAMYTAAYNAGIKVIALNMTPFGAYVGWTAAKQAVLDAVNSWIANAAINIDTKLDLYTFFESPAGSGILNPTYEYTDHIHLNGSGQNQVAVKIFNTGAISGQLICPDGKIVFPKGCYHVDTGYSFDGTNPYGTFRSLINTGEDYAGVIPLTVLAWVYLNSWGVNNISRLMDNGKTMLNFYGTNTDMTFTSNGTTSAFTPAGSIQLNTWYRVAVTRVGDAEGHTNFYINGLRSGAADQRSATAGPVAGSSNLIIGNLEAGSRGLNGIIDNFQLYNRVFSQAEITLDWLSVKSEH